MYKQSPSRNQRSKGIKVKHVLQICLLLAVCFWLIYQVKHSHDKKKEFEEHDAKNSLDSARKDEVVKLGRKYLQPFKQGTDVESDKHGEEVEDEEIEDETPVEEETSVEEGNTHADEGKQNKTEVKDENGEGREGVDEEVDDHDQDKSDVEDNQEDDFVDEEKERENDNDQELKDKDSDDKTGQTDTGTHSQEHDDEGGTTRRHEAREENYKADDASSEVTLDTQITSNETVVLGKSNEQGEVNNLEPKNNFNHIDGVDGGQNESVIAESGGTTNEGHLGTTTNVKSETTISNSSVTDVSPTNINSTKESGKVQDFSLLNGNGTVSEHNEEQRVVEEQKESSQSSKLEISYPNSKDNSTFPVNSDLHDSNSTVSSESKSTDPNVEESHTHNVTKSSSEMNYDATSNAEGNSTMTKNSSVIENPEDDGASQTYESLDESKSENSYNMELDTEDSSDSKLYLEEKDVRTDLETLPDIKIGGSNSEDAAAE